MLFGKWCQETCSTQGCRKPAIFLKIPCLQSVIKGDLPVLVKFSGQGFCPAQPQ